MLSGLENPVHLLIVLLVVLLVFGAKRLPEIGRSLGSGIREFQSGVTGRQELSALQRDRAAPENDGVSTQTTDVATVSESHKTASSPSPTAADVG